MRARRFDTWLAAAGVAMVGIGACGQATAPSSPPSFDAAQPYRLYTHCGVLSVTVAGRTFYASPPLSDGRGNPPSGWGNPSDDGTLTMITPHVVEFRDAAGHVAEFTDQPTPPIPTIPPCL